MAKKPDSWFVKKLIELDACTPAIQYGRTYRTFSAAWNNCNADWQGWLLDRLGMIDVAKTCPKYCCDKNAKANVLKRFSVERVAKKLRSAKVE